MRVGLTGGVASGKSTVAALLDEEHGALVVDADALAREVVARGTPGLLAVVEEFGPVVLTDDGHLDRPRVAAMVFGDDAARRRLEAIVHPLVFERSEQIAAAAGPQTLVVHDIPLLAESGDVSRFDAVLVVDVPPEVQLARMTRSRGWSEDEARARLAAQASREQRLAIADHVIDNTGTHDDLRQRVAEVVAALRG